ncbi:MAG: hypothetical protein AVDCRST_MAG74-686 [uncultured Pyrinomonadaceae bacterium]|uniref:DUF2382 domain-containing protein n=1 Tax=uncultured Pyrinomonadaceae bacterium TaxID=2283094 RepID=A0A6J4NLA9_9BACT|nr:MAG: hypothetical protein AVDCRST_MAG74-686 [uncultured Pyrinomonadaceae bacterium]
MATTIVGIFDDFTQAQKAARELTKAGVKQSDVSIARSEGKGYTSYGGAKSKNYDAGESIGGSISDFFAGIFGADDDPAVRDERELYAESVRRGSAAVMVKVEDNMVERAADVLNDNGAIDVERRAAQYRAAGYKGYDPQVPPYNAEQTKTERQTFANQEEVSLPVIEEQLNVGKRVVQRGGVRIHTSITEHPVEEQVTLREEKVTVNRRPADREFTDADRAALNEGDFTVTTRGEEAVVGKQARVVEEVVVGKNVTEREETVRDTVKRTDVEVEEITADAKKSQKARNS